MWLVKIIIPPTSILDKKLQNTSILHKNYFEKMKLLYLFTDLLQSSGRSHPRIFNTLVIRNIDSFKNNINAIILKIRTKKITIKPSLIIFSK